jgi:hypothetical protein
MNKQAIITSMGPQNNHTTKVISLNNAAVLGGEAPIELTYNPKITHDHITAKQRAVMFYNNLKSGKQVDEVKISDTANADAKSDQGEEELPDEDTTKLEFKKQISAATPRLKRKKS